MTHKTKGKNKCVVCGSLTKDEGLCSDCAGKLTKHPRECPVCGGRVVEIRVGGKVERLERLECQDCHFIQSFPGNGKGIKYYV
ncbi:MAG: hypothetical protein ACOC1X_02825 [Promethearchaeota archaeon]